MTQLLSGREKIQTQAPKAVPLSTFLSQISHFSSKCCKILLIMTNENEVLSTTCSLICRFLISFLAPGELSREPSLPHNSLGKWNNSWPCQSPWQHSCKYMESCQQKKFIYTYVFYNCPKSLCYTLTCRWHRWGSGRGVFHQLQDPCPSFDISKHPIKLCTGREKGC